MHPGLGDGRTRRILQELQQRPAEALLGAKVRAPDGLQVLKQRAPALALVLERADDRAPTLHAQQAPRALLDISSTLAGRAQPAERWEG